MKLTIAVILLTTSFSLFATEQVPFCSKRIINEYADTVITCAKQVTSDEHESCQLKAKKFKADHPKLECKMKSGSGLDFEIIIITDKIFDDFID